MAKELFQMTIHELHDLLRTQKVSAQEILQSVFKRIDEKEDAINAFISNATGPVC